MEFTYNNKQYQLIHITSFEKDNQSIQKILVEDSKGEFIAVLAFTVDQTQNILWDFSTWIDPIYQNTKIKDIMMEGYSKIYAENFKGYWHVIAYSNPRLQKLIERKVKAGKLPREILDKSVGLSDLEWVKGEIFRKGEQIVQLYAKAFNGNDGARSEALELATSFLEKYEEANILSIHDKIFVKTIEALEIKFTIYVMQQLNEYMGRNNNSEEIKEEIKELLLKIKDEYGISIVTLTI
ncbi:hypothetical protein [Peribacillus loiseleuriae]|uniref:Uncharacterized protein n=1 Tax=Peribacillus loiseleuriae TaxID=1679170 RepID=A0A0K9GV24_9BACI|nr:hypothetical protein [Peribacillus loiseleuriae]KMY50539.1 hypothetical protein AC625_14350 [Peribacillus loiseleuriae]